MTALDLHKGLSPVNQEAIRLLARMTNEVIGATSGQFPDMRRVLYSIASRQYSSLSEIASETGITHSTVSRICLQLSALGPDNKLGLGLIKYKSLHGDRRVKSVMLTAEGERVMNKVAQTIRDLAKALVDTQTSGSTDGNTQT